MKISYSEGGAPRNPRAEIIQACEDMHGLHLLLSVADETRLEELSGMDVASIFRSVGGMAMAAADAIMDSLDEAGARAAGGKSGGGPAPPPQ
jgi:hypothetical protein